MHEVKIKKAILTDLAKIQALCNELGEQSYSFDNHLSTTWASSTEGKQYYKERISEEKGIVFVAEKDGEIVGFVSATVHDPGSWRLTKRVEIDNLFLKDHARGFGIGKQLIEEVKAYGKTIGAERVILTAFVKNERAIAFYKREGFDPYELTLEIKLP